MTAPDSPSAEKLSEHCQRAVAFYLSKPGLAGVGGIIDLYEICAMIARRNERLEEFLDRIARFGESFDAVENAPVSGRAIAAALAKHAREALQP